MAKKQRYRSPSRMAGAIWVVVVAVLLAAGAVAGFLLWQQSQRDEAREQHDAAAAAYTSAWDGLESVIADSGELIASADEAGIDPELLRGLGDALADAEAIERIEAVSPDALDADALRARTGRLEAGARELERATSALSDELEAAEETVAEQLLNAARQRLGAAVASGEDARDRAGRVDDGALLGDLEGALADARSLLEDDGADAATLDDAATELEEIVAEVESAIKEAAPKHEDADGEWCSSRAQIGCFTVTLPTMKFAESGSENDVKWATDGELSGCLNFTVTPKGGGAGGFAMIYCPEGVPMTSSGGVPISDRDDPSQDRIFTGQGYPMDMATRKRP